jgi:hypothetical protein
MRSRSISAVLASVVSALLLCCLAPAAGADSPIHPGIYKGTTATGGTVQFRVSADGTRVTSFRVTKVPDTCGRLFDVTVDVAVPIVGERFSSGIPSGLALRGAFSASRRARGTVAYSVVNVRDDGCEPKRVRWTATTPPRAPLVSYHREGGIAGGAGPFLVVSRDRGATVTDGLCQARFTLKPGAWSRLREALRSADLPAIAGDYFPPEPVPDGITYVIEAGRSTVRIAIPSPPEHEQVMRRLEPLLDALARTVRIGELRMPSSCGGGRDAQGATR